jgi:hypothetical protein
MKEKAKATAESFEKQFVQKAEQRQLEREEFARQQAEAEARTEKLEQAMVGIRGWLSKAYAHHEGWKNLNLDLRAGSDTSKSLSFPVIPYSGLHLPPLDLALAPAGTNLLIEDDPTNFSGVVVPNRFLLAVYQGERSPARNRGFVTVAGGSSDTPRLLLETEYYPDQHELMGSTCKLTVQYKDACTARVDSCTRLVLEKVFSTDFDRPVKVMDLPTVIDGTPVNWDLVVRCYPAWIYDLRTGDGRWMSSSSLDEEYLSLCPPSLHIKQTENPYEPVIWSDDARLLSSGSFQTSSEEMIERVRSWRDQNGYGDAGWQGGNQLHIVVRKYPDRHAITPRPIHVAVRVILRVRTWSRG